MPEINLARELARDWQALVAGALPRGLPTAESFVSPSWLPQVGPAGTFAELEEVRRAWTELRASGRAEHYAERLITPQWTLKDVLAHVASWTSELCKEAEQALRHEAFDYQIEFEPRIGPTAWNHARVEERRGWTLAEVFEELESGTRRLQDLALTLPLEALATGADFPAVLTRPACHAMWRSVAEVLLAKGFHDRHHLARIEQALAAAEYR